MTALGRLLVAGVALASFAGGLERADDRKDRDAIQGTWIVTKHEVNGNDGGGTEDSKLSLAVQGDKF